tara:strand:- start:780 stop:995 length:216 start_codon:yes stop_codon:yes gene_type:complete
MSKFNFQVKANPKAKDQSIESQKLIKKFLQKWKKSGLLKELRDRQYPVTRGQKARKKKTAGKRRAARKDKK